MTKQNKLLFYTQAKTCFTAHSKSSCPRIREEERQEQSITGFEVELKKKKKFSTAAN